MQLMEQGKIDLNENIKNYLPRNFLTKLRYDEPITMIHLMNHQAGFEDYVFDLGYSSKEQVPSLESSLKIAEPSQIYKPGEVVAYSNYATSLAAFIVEQVSGQDFGEYVNEHIFSKVNMQHSSANLSTEKNHGILKEKAKGYTLLEESIFKEFPPFYISLYPSGGMNGTAEDLAKFAIALMPKKDDSGSLLFKKKETLERMFSQSYSGNENIPGISHGFWEYDGILKGFTHPGNTPSFTSNFHIVREENFAVIILTNQANEVDLVDGLMTKLVGEKEIVVSDSNDTPNAREIEGTYLNARNMKDSFFRLYYYFSPLKVTALNANEIEVSLSGNKAEYIQTKPNLYQLKKDNPSFRQISTIYFHVENGSVIKISVPFSDYLPIDKSEVSLLVQGILSIFCVIYFLISPFVLLVLWILNLRKKRKFKKVEKWNCILLLTNTGIVINVGILASKILVNSYRSYSEFTPHFYANYGLTALSSLAVICMIANWKKEKLSKPQKIFYKLSMLGSITFIYMLILWHFFS